MKSSVSPACCACRSVITWTNGSWLAANMMSVVFTYEPYCCKLCLMVVCWRFTKLGVTKMFSQIRYFLARGFATACGSTRKVRLYLHLKEMCRTSTRLSVLPFGIVVEPSHFMGLAADYPFWASQQFTAFSLIRRRIRGHNSVYPRQSAYPQSGNARTVGGESPDPLSVAWFRVE
jgi:hypothetical protein